MGSLEDLSRQLRERHRAAASDPKPKASPFQPHRSPALPQELDPETKDRLAALRDRAPDLHTELELLDPAQLRAVLSRDPSALVQAHVGSGKTTVLVQKVLTLNRVDGIPLNRLAVLTFTNKAAGEIRDRLFSASSTQPQPHETWLMGTFHSVARRLLTRALPIESIGYPSTFTVLDEHELEDLRSRLILENRLDIRRRKRLGRRLSHFLREGTDTDGQPPKDDLPRLAQIETEAKRRLGVMDFDDLIVHATHLLQHSPLELAPQWIVVDEFQDTDTQELAFLEALLGPNTSFFGVGDPNQIIYAWRGSDPDLFETFQTRHRCERYSLPINYRSTRSILEAARAFLELEPTDLVGIRDLGQPIRIVRHHSPFIEAEYLTHRMKRLHSEGLPWSEMAILFRTRRQAHPFLEAFARNEIPCQESVRLSLKDLPALDWFHRLLRAAVCPRDIESFRYAITHPRYGLLSKKVWHSRSWQSWLRQHDVTECGDAVDFLQQRCGSHRDEQDRLEVCRRIAHFNDWLSSHSTPDRLAQDLLEHLQINRWLHPTSATFEKDRSLIQRYLDDLLIVFGSESSPTPQDIRAGISEIALGGHQLLQDEIDPHADVVRLLTLHASKGLEFSHVFLSGACEGLLPLTGPWRGPDSDAEEKRLFFVGLTRARNVLEISYHTEPEFRSATPHPSPFLSLLPPALVEWTTPETASQKPTPRTDAQNPDRWSIGMSVQHKRYGTGTISGFSGEQILCAFPGYGTKSFSEAFAPLSLHDPS